MIPPSALIGKLRNGDIILKSGKVYKVPVVEGLLKEYYSMYKAE